MYRQAIPVYIVRRKPSCDAVPTDHVDADKAGLFLMMIVTIDIRAVCRTDVVRHALNSGILLPVPLQKSQVYYKKRAPLVLKAQNVFGIAPGLLPDNCVGT
jgi:hypothetical protein